MKTVTKDIQTKNDLLIQIANTRSELLHVLNQFSQQNINTIPFEGSWTGGQVAEHILKSLSGIVGNITGAVKPTERNPEEYIQQLRDIFLNMDIKMKSPQFIIPSDDLKNKEELVAALGKTMENIKENAASEDLNKTCTFFEMSGLGALTCIEWISFALYHTQRHTNQLRNILNHLN